MDVLKSIGLVSLTTLLSLVVLFFADKASWEPSRYPR